MKIGIVTPAVMFGEFVEYFNNDFREFITNYSNNNNVPAPSIIAKGLIDEGHFVRIFTIGKENKIFHSDKIDIIICKANVYLSVLCPLGEFNRAFALFIAIRTHYKDLDVLHSHWTYYTALSTVPFSKRIKTFCTVRDWTPIIISYLPKRKQKIGLYYNAIQKKMPKSISGICIVSVIAKVLANFLAGIPNFYWKSKLLINNFVLRQKQITFIANSLYSKELIENKIKKNVPCIMNMIDDNGLLSKPKSRNISHRIITIQSMLDRRKNIGTLIEALQFVKRELPDIRLSFLYSFPKDSLRLYEEYKTWLSNGWLDIVDIHCEIPHDEIYNYIDESALLVHPSLEESFGNTIVEGMMRRTPILGGEKSGAVPYLLDFGKRGYICDVNSPIVIAKTIIHIFEDYDKALIKAEVAYDWVSKNNSRKAIIEQHIKCFTN